jgi:AGZA family xanthine/uracil permease-like MFS transporter
MGKTVFTANTFAILLLPALFFTLLFAANPSSTFCTALIIVGMLMISPIKNLNFDGLIEVTLVFAMIALMRFSFNTGIGLTAGFAAHAC